MKSYPHLFAKLFAAPLMLHAPVRLSFEQFLLARMSGGDQIIPAAALATTPQASAGVGTQLDPALADIGEPGTPMQDWVEYSRDARATQKQLRIERIYQRVGNVAVIQIHGVIDKMITQFEMDCYGGCDLADIDQALSLALQDPRVEKVVLDIDSPGGSVIGVSDTATRIAALREVKEVHAFIPALAASAGYYLASQADHIVSASSAIIGSIGVYCAVLDASAYYDKMGAKMQFIKAGKFKTMGTEWRPLSEEETKIIQAGVDRNYAEFKAACTELRDIADSTMQGQWWPGSEAQGLNLVDEVTNATLDEYVAALLNY